MSNNPTHPTGLNGVRPRRPEQLAARRRLHPGRRVSMESGLEGRNNQDIARVLDAEGEVSMESGLEGRNNQGG